ncbi:hypothetical protein ElyMa_001682000 [Elysia marginata]|uniref:Uncharacterized protein n=1 Tax=Elysia marginata TaxID=1093978 RepID=A0AAV4JR04_9GAST|nr:hypothetical protein ElyMa_001682000 [Elysia marginata]
MAPRDSICHGYLHLCRGIGSNKQGEITRLARVSTTSSSSAAACVSLTAGPAAADVQSMLARMRLRDRRSYRPLAICLVSSAGLLM